uniref:Uncharacterized protein n=1 Tax=Peromyscus maniculatus bairdii TaxID=230844 RepID=A0A8C8UNV6_PERMB
MKHSFTEDHYAEFSKYSQDQIIGTEEDIILPTTTRGTVPPLILQMILIKAVWMSLTWTQYAGFMRWAGSDCQRKKMKRRTLKRKNWRKRMMMMTLMMERNLTLTGRAVF